MNDSNRPVAAGRQSRKRTFIFGGFEPQLAPQPWQSRGGGSRRRMNRTREHNDIVGTGRRLLSDAHLRAALVARLSRNGPHRASDHEGEQWYCLGGSWIAKEFGLLELHVLRNNLLLISKSEQRTRRPQRDVGVNAITSWVHTRRHAPAFQGRFARPFFRQTRRLRGSRCLGTLLGKQRGTDEHGKQQGKEPSSSINLVP
jgi:hypothetical protein